MVGLAANTLLMISVTYNPNVSKNVPIVPDLTGIFWDEQGQTVAKFRG